jgi:hypothetical protein
MMMPVDSVTHDIEVNVLVGGAIHSFDVAPPVNREFTVTLPALDSGTYPDGPVSALW